jgi:uncharacterized protein YbjT (DUF2867 family)
MILITGATGTVGREVVQRLSAQAVPVRAVTRDVRRAEANAPPAVQFVQGDFDDPESMQRACAGVERAFLLTNSTERAEQQQLAFTRVAQRSEVRHIVKLSHLHADASSRERFLRYHVPSWCGCWGRTRRTRSPGPSASFLRRVRARPRLAVGLRGAAEL